MRILVTGSSGFLGTHTLVALSSHDTVTVNRRRANKNSLVCDIASTDFVDKVQKELMDRPIDVVLHIAAVTPWSDSPDWDQDKAMARNILAIADALSIPKIVYISGWNVYDMTNHAPPFDESTPTGAMDDYGKSKLAVEQLLQTGTSDRALTCIRLASVYGPGQVSPGLITNSVQQALADGIIHLNSAVTRRDYLYVQDAAVAIARLTTETDWNGAINLGSGKSLLVLEVAQTVKVAVEKTMGKEVQILQQGEGTEAAIIDNKLDISLARQLGILSEPLTPFMNGVLNYVGWAIKR